MEIERKTTNMEKKLVSAQTPFRTEDIWYTKFSIDKQ